MTVPRVLVVYATKHGSTAGIAAAIAEGLAEAGLRVEQETVDRIASVDRYDAVILGSAVYRGRWLREADEFGRRLSGSLAGRATWLFSSGPLDHTTAEHNVQPPSDVADLALRIRARGHVWFGGALTGDDAGFVERVMIRRGSGGDFRDLDAVTRWAREIARGIHVVGEPLAVR